MPNAFSLGMIPFEIYFKSFVCVFWLTTDYGVMKHELCFYSEGFYMDPDHLQAYVKRLWDATISRLIHLTCILERTDIIPLDGGAPFTVIQPPITCSGLFTEVARQGEVPLIVFDTGHCDQYSLRRFSIPMANRAWQKDGILTDKAFATLYDFWAVFHMAFLTIDPVPPVLWLLHYRDVVERTTTNPYGIAFRRPEFIRICSHTGRAPDTVTLDW